MPKKSDRVVRMEVQLPPELAAKFQAAIEPRTGNAWVVYLISKWLQVPYQAPKQGRPPKRAE